MNTIDLLDPLVVDALASGIIEQGGNDSAGYVRFADGTQIAWVTVQSGAMNNAFGGVYISSVITSVTWPASFTATPKCYAQAISDAGNSPRWAGHGTNAGSSTTSPPVWAITGQSTTNTATIRLVGIGRWK